MRTGSRRCGRPPPECALAALAPMRALQRLCPPLSCRRAACPGVAEPGPVAAVGGTFSAHWRWPADAAARAARRRARVGDARSIRDGARTSRPASPVCARRGHENASARLQRFAFGARTMRVRSPMMRSPSGARPACACRGRAGARRSRWRPRCSLSARAPHPADARGLRLTVRSWRCGLPRLPPRPAWPPRAAGAAA